MPISQTNQIDVKDLQQNAVLGIALPFDGSPVFKPVYSTQDAAKYKLINLLLTNRGEKLYDPNFGCDLRRQLFEPIDGDYSSLRLRVIDSIEYYVPEVEILNIEITPDRDAHILKFQLSYKMKLSGNPDQIIIDFE